MEKQQFESVAQKMHKTNLAKSCEKYNNYIILF